MSQLVIWQTERSRPRRYLAGIVGGLLVALSLLSGCAGGTQGPANSAVGTSMASVNPGMGRIFVYRPLRFMGSTWSPSITLNGQTVGRLGSGESFFIDCRPGDYTLQAVLGWNAVPDPSQRFSVGTDETLYVRFVAEMSGWKLDVMPPQMATSEIRSTRLRDSSFAVAGGTYQPTSGGQSVQSAPAPIASLLGARGPAQAKPPANDRSMPVASLFGAKGPTEAKPRASDRSREGGSIVPTPDEAERMLEIRPALQTQGLYALDGQTAFNVLDSAFYDPASKRLSLVGHSDPKYRGPKIPYLQHLAVLLGAPRPEFSLNWTPDTERRIDAFFSQHVVEGLTSNEADNLMAKWGRIADASGNLTRSGQLLMTAAGLSPIDGGRAPGFAGVAVAPIPGTVWIRVIAVQPGSPAEAAGLRDGDVIRTIRGFSPLNPLEFSLRIRMSGAGQAINIVYVRTGSGGVPTRTQLTPTESPDSNPWSGTNVADVLKALYWSASDFKAALAMDVIGKMLRNHSGATEEIRMEIRGLLFNAVGLRGLMNADSKAVDENRMTMVEAMHDLNLKLCRSLDETFHFSGTPVGNTYEATYHRIGGDPSSSLPPAMQELDRQMMPKVEELLNVIFARPEGLQIAPELVDEQFHLRPEMVPEYMGLPEDTLLAQVLFNSDYLCKRLMNRPELKAKIPHYLSGFEFEVKHPEFRHPTGNYRIWISVAKLDTPQSTSGTTLALRDLKMRFNIRDHEGGSASGSAAARAGRDLPNKPGSYEDLLTSLWDDFEVEYPTLHELRETAKLAAAARWMLSHDSKTSLPLEGRTHWQGPKKVPGLVFMELAPDPTLGMSKTRVTTIASGGVSEAPPADLMGDPYPSDPSVVDLRGTSFGGPPAGTHVYTATAPSQGASVTASSPLSVGWVAPPDASDGARSAVVVTTTFGSKVVKVDFSGEKKAPGAIGNNTKAGDQLKAAAATAANGGNLTQNFDIGGARTAGNLSAVAVDTTEVERMKAWEKLKDDPRMAPVWQGYLDLQAKREQLNTERDELTLKRNQAGDLATTQRLDAELLKKDKEYQANLVALAAKKDEVEKVKRMINTDEEGSASVPETSKTPVTPESTPTPSSISTPASTTTPLSPAKP